MKAGLNKKSITIYSGVIVLIISVLIKVTSFFPEVIEKYYSRGVYPAISWFYRTLFGWIPFSIGDLFYFFVGCVLIWRFLKFIKVIAQGRLLKVDYPRILKRSFFILSAVYIFFNLSWGLNYNRPGIASQLQLEPQTPNLNELKAITSTLIFKVNDYRKKVNNTAAPYQSHDVVFEEAHQAYQKAAVGFPFLQYDNKSIKKSLYGKMGNMLGFLGYFNPFTGEAQLNMTMPKFLVPYVSCHELAHQLGYASESEANFVGYLAAINSKDTVFHYSTYFDLFNYANHELFLRDSIAAKENITKLDTLVKSDIKELKEYWRKSNNPIEPIIKVFYDHYLKANQQSNGLKSYNEVVGWLIAYNKKYGRI